MTIMEPVWIDIGKLDDIPVRGARVVKTAKGCVALFRTAENEVYAIDDRCPHKGGPAEPRHRAWPLGDLPVAQLGD